MSMKTRKKIMLSLALALYSLCSTAGEPGMTFLFTNGQKASFAFAYKPEINVGDDGITISSSNTDSVSYTFADVQRFYFEDDIETGIQDVSSDASVNPVFSYSNGKITVSGLKSTECVSVFSVSGSKIAEAKADNAGYACIGLSGVASGVYVVSTGNGVSFKLLKK